MSGHTTGSDTIDEPSKKRVRLAGTATVTCSTASAVNPASSTRSQPEEVEPPAIEHSVTESAEVDLTELVLLVKLLQVQSPKVRFLLVQPMNSRLPTKP